MFWQIPGSITLNQACPAFLLFDPDTIILSFPHPFGKISFSVCLFRVKFLTFCEYSSYSNAKFLTSYYNKFND